MNFNVYDLNKIFEDQIRSLPSQWKYGFNYWGRWDNPKSGEFFEFSLNSKNYNLYQSNWFHAPCSFNKFLYLRCCSYFYKVDQNHFFHNTEEKKELNFHINQEVSLRELILFMIYMKHLSNI